MPLLPDRVREHVVGDDQRGERIGLMLALLPAHRGLLKGGQVTRDPHRARLKGLQQRRAAGDRVTAAAPAALRGPRGHLDWAVQLVAAQCIADDSLIRLARREALDGDLRRDNAHRSQRERHAG